MGGPQSKHVKPRFVWAELTPKS